MSKEKPLLSRKIMINDDYAISIGTLLYSSIIMGIQAVGIIAGAIGFGIITISTWFLAPGLWTVLLAMATSLRSRKKEILESESDLKVIIEKLISIEDRLDKLEEKIND